MGRARSSHASPANMTGPDRVSIRVVSKVPQSEGSHFGGAQNYAKAYTSYRFESDILSLIALALAFCHATF